MKKSVHIIIIIFLFVSIRLCDAQPLNTSTSYLDINNIRALINSDGDLFHDKLNNGIVGFEVPKNTGMGTIYDANLWIGGYDQYGELHVSCGSDFTYGPLRKTNILTTNWNSTWKINQSTIDSFKTHRTDPDYKIPASILNWPANGNISNGEAQTLAPYYDNDNDGVYNPYKGDYPKIRGDQAVYFIINDSTPHEQTGGMPLWLEIHGMAYEYTQPTEFTFDLSYEVFVNYQIINRSVFKYDSLYIGLWADMDIGRYAYEDFIGCDSALSSFFVYNVLPIDGPGLYGANPPAQGITFLSDRMNSFMADMGIWFPSHNLAEQSYYLLTARWTDGEHLIYGGDGRRESINNGRLTNYMYPGNGWYEGGLNNPPGYPEGIGAIGPITLAPGESKCIDMAYTFARVYPPTNNLYDCVELLKGKIAVLKRVYDINIAGNCDDISVSSTNATSGSNTMSDDQIIYPNPAKDKLFIDFSYTPSSAIQYLITDIVGNKVASGYFYSQTNTIPVNNLPQGIYIIRVTGSESVFTKKFVIE